MAALKAENIQPKGDIPDFPNNLTGYIQSINYLMSVYYPEVNYGWQENAWANSSNQFVHENPQFWGGSVEDNAKAISDVLMGVISAAKLPAYQPRAYTVEGKEIIAIPNFLAIDKYEADDYNSASTYSGGADYSIQAQGNFFNYPDWLAYMRFVKQVSENINSPIMLWQIPGGHLIQDKDDTENPYNASTSGNFFLGSASTDKDGLQPEMTNPENDEHLQAYMRNEMPTGGKYFPENQTIAKYLTNDSDRQPDGYNWKNNNMKLTADSHVFAILWGGGSTTTVIPNAAIDRAYAQVINDGGWLNNQIKNYYKHPQKLN